MPVELAFVIGLIILLVLAVKVRVNELIALQVTALVLGLLSGMSGTDTVKTITDGFADILRKIGIVIIFGSFAALGMTLFGWIFAHFYLAKKKDLMKTAENQVEITIPEGNTFEEKSLQHYRHFIKRSRSYYFHYSCRGFISGNFEIFMSKD